MRRTAVIVLLTLAATACAPKSPPPKPHAPDIARTEPNKGQDKPTSVFDEATRRAEVEKRFPGFDTLDLVRVVAWTGDSTGACFPEMAPAWETKVDARYRVGGEREKTASSFGEMKDQGWLAVYRTPNGTGLERKAAFDSIDLTFVPQFSCRCQASRASPEQTKVPLRLRLRWQGKGKLPEVSGAIVGEGDQKQGLKLVFAAGNLVTYEAPFSVPYPAGHAGACTGSVALYLLGTPPMM